MPLDSGTITPDHQSSETTLLSKAILHNLQIQSTPPVTSIFYRLSCDLILTCSLSILELAHSHINLRCSSWLSSEVVFFHNPIKVTHVDCNLFLGICIIQIFSMFFPDPSQFILSRCQPPISSFFSAATLHIYSFCITHLLPKQFPILIHILIHLRSKLFVYFLFASIHHSGYNRLSTMHTSFFCLFIASCQHLLITIINYSGLQI